MSRRIDEDKLYRWLSALHAWAWYEGNEHRPPCPDLPGLIDAMPDEPPKMRDPAKRPVNPIKLPESMYGHAPTPEPSDTPEIDERVYEAAGLPGMGNGPVSRIQIAAAVRKDRELRGVTNEGSA